MCVAEIIAVINQWRATSTTLAVDIEGITTGVTCIGFAWSSVDAFVIPFETTLGESYWNEVNEVMLWEAIQGLMEDGNVVKIAHNGLYEKFVLGWCYGINIVNMAEDTMVKHFELFCEMEKSLGFCASIYTTQSYYKGDRKSLNDQVALTYNALDCLVTYEINEVMNQHITEAQLKHYRFNISCLNALTYMSLKGILYDREAALASAVTIQRQIYELQHQLNQEAGLTFPSSEALRISAVVTACCRKAPKRKTLVTIEGKRGARQKEINTPVEIRTWEDVEEFCKESCQETLGQISRILGKCFGSGVSVGDGRDNQHCADGTQTNPPSPVEQGLHTGSLVLEAASMGELSSLLGLHLNIDSTDQLGEFLYVKKGLPKQFKKERGKLTDRLTTGASALLNIYVKTKDPVIKLVLKLRSLMTQVETLYKASDPDGRIRCGYNLIGAATSRISCYESPTGSGFNLQTVTKTLRYLFGADLDHSMAQCDLRGADGWTVAVRAAMEGDTTMLDDLVFGIKPANVIALMYERGSAVNQLSRPELKELGKTVDGDGWLYLACKKTLYGSLYLMGKNTMSDGILGDSYDETGEPVYVAPKICEFIQQQCLFVRYPGIKRWHDKTKQKLVLNGKLVMGDSGHERMFFGRKQDNATLGQALAQEPQFNTTYATLLALCRLWSDPENRRSDGSLIIEPMHTVHDSLVTQFLTAIKEWAKEKHKQYFDNEITIGNTKIVIPFAGTVGKDWGMKGAEAI